MSTPQGPLAGRRVLLVEYHDASRDMMRQLLEHEGAVVIDTASVDTAIIALNAATVDVVLTDVSLRGAVRDGLGLLREIRSTERLAGIPVIALTGHKSVQPSSASSASPRSSSSRSTRWRWAPFFALDDLRDMQDRGDGTRQRDLHIE